MGAECVELVDDEPQSLITRWGGVGCGHGFENGEAEPGGNHGGEGCDLAGVVGEEERAGFALSYPVADGEGFAGLLSNGFEGGDSVSGDGADGAEHAFVSGFEEGLGGGFGEQGFQFLGRGLGQ